MFKELEEINSRPEPFRFYTAEDLWTDKHTSKQMLEFHLNESVDLSSRSKKFIERSVEWIVSHFGVGEGTKIVDFGCGPGLYATLLAERKANVTGIDFSERSIRYAKDVATKKGLNINYVHQNYLGFETEERADLIMMIMCDFCALSPVQRKVMLGKFLKILEPGGSVLLDVYSLNAFKRREEVATYQCNLLDGFWSPGKYYGFLNTFKYEKEKVVLDKYTIIEKSRRRTVYNWLQYFSQGSLGAEFERSSFRIEGYYSDVAGTTFDPESAEFAIVAKKP
jgi:cyclopropane fatty-acyl-phospholipid synthase-like methyltransferase